MAAGGVPCGACKFLRRKCVEGCVFAPYFSTGELSAAHFSAIHKIFGASNFSKLLQHIPSEEERYDAVVSISYEAQARVDNPIYGCVSHIFALQQQVAHLKAELTFAHSCLSSGSDAASLNSYGEIPNSSVNSHYGHHCSSNEPQSRHESPSEETAFLSDDNCSYFTINMLDYCDDPISASPMNLFPDNKNSSEVSVEHGGDLEALAFSLLKRNRV